VSGSPDDRLKPVAAAAVASGSPGDRLKPVARRRAPASMRALVFHGPGDLRLEDVPRPEPVAEGDVLVQVEVALTDGTDLKAFQRGHPVLLGPPPSAFGNEFCGIDVGSGVYFALLRVGSGSSVQRLVLLR